MEQAPYFDNGEVLFDFDPYEPASSPSYQDGALSTRDIIEQIRRMETNGQHDLQPTIMLGKGKSPSLPMSIPAASCGRNSPVMSRGIPPIIASPLEGPSSSSSQPSFMPITGEHNNIRSVSAREVEVLALEETNILPPAESSSKDDCTPGLMNASLSGKGKARELAYTLPPLLFSTRDLEYIDWPSEPGSPTAGPSSYGSPTAGFSSYGSAHSSLTRPSPNSLSQTGAQAPNNSTQQQPELTRLPSRRRSLSSLSIHSTRSIAARSLTRMKVKLGSSPNSPGNLARRLLFRNKGNAAATSIDLSPAGSVSDPCLGNISMTAGQSLIVSWKGSDFPCPDFEFPADTRLHVQQSIGGPESLKGKSKGRSYSSPLPQSVFDIIPHGNSDVFVPVPVALRNLFDEVLPRELKLQIFSALVALHEDEFQRWRQSGQWTVLKASSSKYRWISRDRGMRELVKLSRVSKAWRSLVFDGQLWMNVDLKAFPNLPVPFLRRLAEALGPFIRNMDLTGHVKLDHSTLGQVTTSLCVRSAPTIDFAYTQLLDVNMTGCNELTTQSLHNLIIHSPFLRSLCVKGLKAVDNTTFDVLVLCPHLTSLNVSRCRNINGDGLRGYANAVLGRQGQLALKELRLCGVVDIYDDALGALGRAAPLLEVLDLSYCRTLHNSALEAFVACTEDERGIESVVLTAREAGREARDNGRYRRRITKLRHLSLSNCKLLTDIACSNLAHAVPRLELLELACIGMEMKDEGIVRLLRTTPLLRRLDLEDDTDITDAVMRALTPSPPNELTSGSTRPLQTGHALEHLVVSGATSIGNDALLSLIRNCPRLTVLEADSTGLSGDVLKEFVRHARERNLSDATMVAIDCRAVSEGSVKDVVATTRPRKGWCAWDARKLAYLDARDKEGLKVGQDECDEKRVVIKTFYSWQTVDAVRTARERRRRNSRHPGSLDFASELEDVAHASGRMRWWSPSGRRSYGTNTPDGTEFNDRDGCVIM